MGVKGSPGPTPAELIGGGNRVPLMTVVAVGWTLSAAMARSVRLWRAKARSPARPVVWAPGLAVRTDLGRVVDAVADRLVAVVHHEEARVVGRDGLRAGPGHAAEAAGRQDHGVGEGALLAELAGGLLLRGGAHRVAEGVRVRIRPALAVLAAPDVDAGLVGVLEVRVLEVELAEVVAPAVAVDVAGDDGGLPAGRAAVLAAAVADGGAVAELHAGLVVGPGGARGLDQHGGVEADLLVGGRAEVVVGEDGAEAAVHAGHVHHRVGEPALQRGPRSLPGGLAVGRPDRGRLDGAEEGVVERGERRARGEPLAVGRVASAGRVEGVDGGDALAHRVGRQRAVLVVPAVGRAVGGGEVPLGQVDVLADDVGGGADLVVVELVDRRDQVGVLVHDAVEGVHPHHERLGRLLLGDGRDRVLPEHADALLRVVEAELVEHGVELDVGALVDAGRGGGEGGAAGGA